MIARTQIIARNMPKAFRGQCAAMSTGKVTEDEVKAMLDSWGKGLVGIATAYREGGDYKKVASDGIDALYAYGKSTVLFKPTLASGDMTFRGTKEGAHSYFVAGNPDPKYAQDGGFAIKPWAKADFYIAGIVTGQDHALVMGNKLLKDTSGNLTVANFSMGFMRDTDGSLKINLHHSSLPFTP